MRVRRSLLSSPVALGLVVALLCGATACGKDANTGALAPGSTSASCRLADALHEHAFADATGLRASIHGTVIGRLENRTGPVHARDSHGPGIDAIAYRIDQDTPLRLALGTGTVARAQLIDGSGRTVAEVAAGEPAARIAVARGDYTLLLHGDETRESHFVAHPEACLPAWGRSADVGLEVAADVARAAADVDTPGVYIQELPSASSVIAASTSVAAFVGHVGTGPTDQPILLQGEADLARQFGEAAGETLVGLAVAQFFQGGGESAYLVGTTSTAAVDLVGDVAAKTGLASLASANGWSILVLPDLAQLSPADAVTVLQSALPLAASALAFTVIDPPTALADPGAFAGWVGGTLLPALPAGFLRNAAVYFPAIDVVTASGAAVAMGAGGVVAGLYAATDASKAVWAQTAGIPAGLLPASIGQPLAIDDATVALLLESGVNPIRDAASAGTTSPVVWEDRTLAPSGELGTYVPESRTLLMLEASIEESLQWVVFEPNDPTLWNGVTALLSAFLTQEWQAGALAGDTAADAFSVRCDATNNPPETATLGYLSVEVQLQLADRVGPIELSLLLTTES